MAVARLSGEKLRAIAIDPRTGETHFHFDLGATLEVRTPRQFRDDDFELWSLHAPLNRYVSVGAGGVYRTGSTKKPDSELRPIQDSVASPRDLTIGSLRPRRAAAPGTKRGLR